MCPHVSLVLGVLASVLSLAAIVPQLLRALRSRSAEGLSWTSLVLSLATLVLWCVYAGAVSDDVQLSYNLVALALLAGLTFAVVRAMVARRRRSAATAVAAVVVAWLVAALVVRAFDPLALATCGTLVSSVKMVPQTRLALNGSPLWGLDPWSTLLGWLGTILWLAYAVLVGDVPVAACSAILMAMQSTVLAFRLPPRRTLASIAGGRLGHRVARIAEPAAAMFPARVSDYELAA